MERRIRVPQYGPTSPDQPVKGPKYGHFPTLDRDGHGWPLSAFLYMYKEKKCRLPWDMYHEIENGCGGLKTIKIRITWPGYRELWVQINMGSLAMILMGVAIAFDEFIKMAPSLEKKDKDETADDLSQWNITANNLTVHDLEMSGLVHYEDDIFYCEIDRVIRLTRHT